MKESEIKIALLAATARAIGMDIRLAEAKLDAAKRDPGNLDVSALENKIAVLKDELVKTTLLGPATYAIPKKRNVTFTAAKSYDYGSLLELEGSQAQTPKYCIVGIQGADFSSLVAKKRYSLDIYMLRPIDPSLDPAGGYYVYVMLPANQGPGGQGSTNQGPGMPPQGGGQ